MSLFVRPAAVKGSLLNLIRFHLGFDFIKYLRLDCTAYSFNEILGIFMSKLASDCDWIYVRVNVDTETL